MPNFAAKFNRLIAATGKDRLSNQKLSDDIFEKTGTRILRAYLWDLREGKVPYPRLDTIQVLAEYFRVEPSYFTDPTKDAANEARLALLESMRKGEVSNLGVRAAGLSKEMIKRIARIIDDARVVEGLDPIRRSDLDESL